MFIPYDRYKDIANSVPILCVDGVIVKDGKYLLVKRANNPLKGMYWVPGGRVYKSERLEEAFIRKMKEEVNLDVRIVGTLGFYEDFFSENELDIHQVHTVSVVFLASPTNDEVKLDEQSEDYIWSDTLPRELQEALHVPIPRI